MEVTFRYNAPRPLSPSLGRTRPLKSLRGSRSWLVSYLETRGLWPALDGAARGLPPRPEPLPCLRSSFVCTFPPLHTRRALVRLRDIYCLILGGFSLLKMKVIPQQDLGDEGGPGPGRPGAGPRFRAARVRLVSLPREGSFICRMEERSPPAGSRCRMRCMWEITRRPTGA